MAVSRTIYSRTDDGGVQLASGSQAWELHDDYVHLCPLVHNQTELRRYEAEPKAFVDSPERQALVIVDMQNDFCSPGGWAAVNGMDVARCRQAVLGVKRALRTAREFGMWVVWVQWDCEPDLRSLGANTLFSYKHSLSQKGIGEELEHGPVLTRGSWGADIIDELKADMREPDIRVAKIRASGFYGTRLDQVLRSQGVSTLFFAGVNTDQCVGTTLQDAYFRDYACVLLTDATATTSPDYCKDATVYNTKGAWGFVMDTATLAAARPL